MRITRVGKTVLKSIPILSIFALVGNCLLIHDPVQAFSCAGVDVPNDYTNTNDGCYGIPKLRTPEAITTTASLKGASLIIDNGVIHDRIQSIYGTNYVSHTVSVVAEQIEGYVLTLSGDTKLTGPSNAKNNWSYAWDDTIKADSTMSYKAMGSNISLSGTAVSAEGKVNFSKKLAFATTFADNATPGAYSGQATLSLVVTPKTITSTYVPWDKMIYMQDMSLETCANASIGATKSLYGYRSAKLYGIALADGGLGMNGTGDKYTVQKLADGNCWMTSNMKINLSNIDLESELSDLNTGMTFAKGTATQVTSASGWSSASATAQFNSNGFGNSNYNAAFGSYYSWCAATAGTCSGAATNGAEAAGSICPKGWKLPRGGLVVSDNDFAQLMNREGANITSITYDDKSGDATSVSWTGKFFYSYPANFTLGGANWYLTGNVFSSGLSSGGSSAYYASRTARSSTVSYALSSSSTLLFPAKPVSNYYGLPVRRVAYSS